MLPGTNTDLLASAANVTILNLIPLNLQSSTQSSGTLIVFLSFVKKSVAHVSRI